MLPSGNEKWHEHKNSEVRADFSDLRWGPPAAPPAPRLARSARQGGGSSAGPRNPRGVPTVYVYGVFLLLLQPLAASHEFSSLLPSSLAQ
eukprot:5108211-Pyramimonas_sp.AAC.1